MLYEFEVEWFLTINLIDLFFCQTLCPWTCFPFLVHILGKQLPKYQMTPCPSLLMFTMNVLSKYSIVTNFQVYNYCHMHLVASVEQTESKGPHFPVTFQCPWLLSPQKQCPNKGHIDQCLFFAIMAISPNGTINSCVSPSCLKRQTENGQIETIFLRSKMSLG
jgi:hypothetical protein